MSEPKRKRLKGLSIELVSLVDEGANPDANVVLLKSKNPSDVALAEWTTAFINNLPDSSFAVIEPGGEKDDTGKTQPRSLRHLPYKDANGKVDLPHLRNALSRLPQSDLSADLKAKARRKLEGAAQEAGVGKQHSNEKGVKHMDENVTLEDLQKQLADAQAALKSADEAKAQEVTKREEIEKQLAEMQAKLDALKPADELQKRADLPDEVRKQLEKNETELAELRKERQAERDARDVEIKKAKVAGLKSLAMDVEKGATLLHRIAKAVTAEDYAELERLLDAANAAAEKGIGVEKGKPGHGAGRSVQDEVFAKADAMVADKKAASRSDAIGDIFRSDPDLYKRYMKESATGHIKEDE